MASLRITNPANGKLIETVAADEPASVRAKGTTARAAQPQWARLPLKRRLEAIRSFRDAVSAKTEELAAILTEETGKPITQSRNELSGLIPRLDFFLAETPRVLRPEKVLHDRRNHLREEIRHEPLGVVANISAWNYPYFVGSNVFVPALLTGNAVLYKPSEFATLTGLAITESLLEAGVPRGAFDVVVGASDAGRALLDQPLDGFFFTGSYATGRKVAEAAARHLARVQLELGGKDPVYVADDVDTDQAAHAVADGAFYNNGQSCCAVERVYVHEVIHDAFVEAFVDAVRAFVVGDPM